MEPNLMSYCVYQMLNGDKKQATTANQEVVLQYQEIVNHTVYNTKHRRRYTANEQLFSKKNTNEFIKKNTKPSIVRRELTESLKNSYNNNLDYSFKFTEQPQFSNKMLNLDIYKKSKKHLTQMSDLEKPYGQDTRKYYQKVQRFKERKLAKGRSNPYGLDIKKLDCDKINIATSTTKERTLRRAETPLTIKTNLKKYTSNSGKTSQFKIIKPDKEVIASLKKKNNINRFSPEKQLEGPSLIAEKKFHNYKEFLNIVQLAYNSYLAVDNIKKYEKNSQEFYKVYVGPGNNKNLILSIFKKRWWWKIADTVQEADFVWTQLKINDIFAVQQTSPKTLLKQRNCKKQSKHLINNENLLKLFHKDDNNLFLLLTDTIEVTERQSIIHPIHMHNHLESNFMLGNKKALFKNLSLYYSFKSKNVYDIIPMTYHVEKVQGRSFKQFCRTFKSQPSSFWIVKPGENSNRGQGIHVTNKLQDIKRLVSNTKHTYIIQEYIQNLFLFQRRKFDIRTYMLVNRINQVTKAYWYCEGYLRTSSVEFNLDDLDDPIIHLTNDAIQKFGDDYGKYQHGNKVSYNQFQRYLDFYYPNEKFQMTNLVSRMKIIATQAIKATYFKLDPNQRINNMEIFGLDFIVDRRFQPWLLQINTNPCLQLSSQLLGRLIPSMVQNAIRISVDSIFPPLFECPPLMKCYLPDNFLQNNRFQLIFDSQFDRDIAFQQHSANGILEIYEEEDEVFDNEGQILILND